MFNIQRLRGYMLSNNNFITYNTIGPTKNTIGPTKNTIGPTKNTIGPTKNTIGPTKNTIGPTKNTIGPTKNTIGPTKNTIGPTKNTIGHTKKNKTHHDLFWCVYSCITNEDYENTFKEKNKFIMGFLEQIKKNKTILKENKLQYIKIEQCLLYDKTIDLNVVKAICLYHQINIVYVLNNIYYKFIGDIENSTSFFVIKNINNQYTVLNETNPEILDTIYKQYYYVLNINKIIYNINHYKVSELKDIANKLNTSQTGKKIDIYTQIKIFLEKN